MLYDLLKEVEVKPSWYFIRSPRELDIFIKGYQVAYHADKYHTFDEKLEYFHNIDSYIEENYNVNAKNWTKSTEFIFNNDPLHNSFLLIREYLKVVDRYKDNSMSSMCNLPIDNFISMMDFLRENHYRMNILSVIDLNVFYVGFLCYGVEIPRAYGLVNHINDDSFVNFFGREFREFVQTCTNVEPMNLYFYMIYYIESFSQKGSLARFFQILERFIQDESCV